MPIFSREVEKTLRRALSEANQRRHDQATLEHLLLVLTDDADAKPVLEDVAAMFVGYNKLRANMLNRNLKN
jgi:ATP-dependent Clp protease ATP-binding subunit ClpA